MVTLNQAMKDEIEQHWKGWNTEMWQYKEVLEFAQKVYERTEPFTLEELKFLRGALISWSNEEIHRSTLELEAFALVAEKVLSKIG